MNDIKMKKAAYIVFSVIFLTVSGVIATKIIKEEIEKGQAEQEELTKTKDRNGISKERKSESFFEEGSLAADIAVESKEDANKALSDLDSLVDSLEKNDSELNN